MPTKMKPATAPPLGTTALRTLEAYREAINTAIEQFLDTIPDALGFSPEALSPHSLDALAKLREYTMRPGKRIRGSLAAAAYDDAKQTHLAEAGIALGVAQELIQAYILITDDVTDRSDLRRGKPTVHQEYAAELDQYGDEHEANMQAIYVGMIGQHLANLALLQAPERPEHIALSLHRLHRALTITGFGQLDDVAHKVGRSITEHDVVRTYCLKTGYYTFVNPLQTGALLAGVSDMATEQQITEFGQATGVVFQLHDDYLGVFGEVSATGKPSLDDLKEGKYTLLVHYALEHATPDDAMALRRILGNVQVTPADLRRAQEIFTDSGATLYTQTEMHEYAAIAQERLASTPIWSEQFKAFLSGLMDYMASRQS